MDDSSPAAAPRSIRRRLFDLSWPVIGINVLGVLALAVDTRMLGGTAEAEAALTGLGYATQITFVMMVAMMGLTIGTVAFVARAHGARQDGQVNHLLIQATMLTILLGAIVAVVGNVVARPIMAALGAAGPDMDAGLAYLRPMLIGATFNYLNILYAAILRGLGNTRPAFQTAFVMNVLNVVFNYGLIFGNYGLPELGIRGAAYGTVGAQAVAVALMVWILRSGRIKRVTLPLRVARLDLPLARKLWKVGAPAAMDMIVLNAAFLSIVGMLGRIDGLAVAAHGVGLRVQALAFVPGMSIAQATGAMVGNALGAGNLQEARAVVRSGVLICSVIMTVLAFAFIAGAEPIVALFHVDPSGTLGTYAVMWIKLLGWCMPVVGPYIALTGAFRGAGSTKLALRINAWSTLALQIPLSWLLGFPLGLGAFGVWVAFPLSFGMKAGWAWWEYRRPGWAKVGVDARG